MANISNEVKAEILEKVKRGEKVMALSQQYGVSTKTIYYWLRKGTTEEISVVAYNKIRRENDELKAIVGVLTAELERLKKKRR